MKFITVARKYGAKVSAGATAALLSAASFAQTAPTNPKELLEQKGAQWVADTSDVLFSGAGMIIQVLLIAMLIGLVVGFFRRGGK